MAFVGFLARVRPRMAPQIGHLNKLFIAIDTGEWFFARVQPNMRFQMMVPSKPFAACLAGKGFFTGVCSFVVL